MADAPDDSDLQLRKFQKELSAGTVSLALLAVLTSTPKGANSLLKASPKASR